MSMYYLLKEVTFRRHSLPTEDRYRKPENGAEIHFVRRFVRRNVRQLMVKLTKAPSMTGDRPVPLGFSPFFTFLQKL